MPKISGYSESGNPIYQYDEVKDGYTPPVFEDEETAVKIEKHIEKYVGDFENVFHEVVSDTIHIDVYPVLAKDDRKFNVMVTSGMSTLPMNVPKGAEDAAFAELAVILPAQWPVNQEEFKNEEIYWPIRTLKFLARFPHQYRTWLGYGHTIPNGNPPQPFAKNTKMNTIMIFPSISLPREFQQLKISEAKTINFYSIMPLYQEEVDFKLKHGVEKLVDLFDEKGITDIVDINRPNVCKKKFWFL